MPGNRSDELAQTGPDDLLSEVQSRLSDVIGTHERLRRLLEAVMAVGENLDLQGVLRRIAGAAADLVEARYAALGVISDDGQGLSQFIVVGIDHELVETIGELPAGMGVLGELIRDPAPLRLHDLAQHPESYGLPPGHPPMRSFLGVPIRVRDAVFGNLYLTEKVGGGDFDEQDEAIVQALATAAGVAVQNARLYADAELRSRMVEASSEVSTALLSGSDPEQVLALIAARAREVTQARLTFAACCRPPGPVWTRSSRAARPAPSSTTRCWAVRRGSPCRWPDRTQGWRVAGPRVAGPAPTGECWPSSV